MATQNFGETLLTDFDDKEIKKFLDDDALADLKKNSRPASIALNALTQNFIKTKIKETEIFTLTDLFLLMHKEGHKDVKYKSLQTVLSRLTKGEDALLKPQKIVGRQRGYQRA